MRGSFLWRNRVLLTSGALLLLALHLLASGVPPNGRAARPSLYLLDALHPIQLLEAELGADTSNFFRDYLDLVDVRRQNLALQQQLAALEGQRIQLEELKAENQHLSDLLELRDALALKAVGAMVVASDATGLARTVVISQGAANGLRYGMAVISTDGVVGKLIAVGGDAARVLLITDHNSALDAFDLRSRARGIVAGELDGGVVMKYVDRTEDVKAGDAIVTSGMDGIYPRGLLVGHVTAISQGGPGLFLNVGVGPAADFGRLEQVLVIMQKPPALAAPKLATPGGDAAPGLGAAPASG